MAELEQENLLEQYHLPEANTGINEQQARNLIQTPGMVDLLALTNLIETVTVIPTYTPTRFYDQFKIYVDSLTAPSIKVLYIYSNKTNAWIKVGVTDISGEKYIVQEASASLSAEQSLGALTTGLLKNTVTGSTGVLSTATANTDYAAATHATRHQSGGADAIKLDDLAAPDDNTDLNASTSVHGLLKKLSNVSTEYMSGTGAWTALPSNAAITTTLKLGESVTVSGSPVPLCVGEGALVAVLDINATGINKDFGQTSGNQVGTAQSFQEATALIVNAVRLRLLKVNAPTDSVYVSIQTDNAGSPSGTVLASGTISNALLGGSHAQYQIILNTELTTTENVKYWVVLGRTGSLNTTNYYRADSANAIYANGACANTTDGTTWSAGADDLDLELQNANRAYQADANDADRDNFTGFLTATGSVGDTVTLTLFGVLSGFTLLVPNSVYYVQDAIGTIGTGVGTATISVGKALTTTNMFVGKT